MSEYTMTGPEVAEAAGRSLRWVQTLARDHGIQRVGRGRYRTQDVIRAVAAHFEAAKARQAIPSGRERHLVARATEIEERVAERRRGLIAMDEVIGAFSAVTAQVRAETAPFAQLDLGDATSGVLRRELDAALDRIDATAAALVKKLKQGAKL